MSERDEFGGYTEREAMEIMGMPVPAPTPLQSRPVIPVEAVEAVSDEAFKAASDTYMEVLTDLRLKEGGGFKVASQVKRSIHAALKAAAPHMLRDVWDEAYGKGFEAARGEADTPNPYEVEQ